MESAGYVVAALCGLGRTENRPDKITLNPDLLAPPRRAGWTGRGRILDEHQRSRSGSSGVAGRVRACTRRHEPHPAFKEVTRK